MPLLVGENLFKPLQNLEKWAVFGSDFGSRFLATKMGNKSFYKKKLTGNRGLLVVRSSSFFKCLSILAAGRTESVGSCGFYFSCVQEEAKFTRLYL